MQKFLELSVGPIQSSAETIDRNVKRKITVKDTLNNFIFNPPIVEFFGFHF
jgi:hypothetical protein